MTVIINKANTGTKIAPMEMVYRYLYLRKSYMIALDEMPQTNWFDCCQEAIDCISEVGISFLSSPKTVQKLNRVFRQNETLEPPTNDDDDEPSVPKWFQNFPETKQMIHKHLSENMESLSAEYFWAYLLTKLMPKILEEENAEVKNVNQMQTMDFF
jgi:hypothetical protein